MKKIVALAVLAMGMLIGAGTAAAYPPVPEPAITPPVTVAPNAAVTITVSNVVLGEPITLTFLGQSYTKSASQSQSLTPAPVTGSATFDLTAPAEVGTYPVVASIGNTMLNTSVTVAKVSPPTGDGDKGSGAGSGKLPSTGSTLVAPGVGFGLAAVAGGLTLLIVSRRRRSANV